VKELHKAQFIILCSKYLCFYLLFLNAETLHAVIGAQTLVLHWKHQLCPSCRDLCSLCAYTDRSVYSVLQVWIF